MEIKAIRTEADYLAALQEVSVLIDLDPFEGSPEGERLDVLGTLVQAYESKHYPIFQAKFDLWQAEAKLPDDK